MKNLVDVVCEITGTKKPAGAYVMARADTQKPMPRLRHGLYIHRICRYLAFGFPMHGRPGPPPVRDRRSVMSNLVGMMPNLVIDSCLYSKTTAKLRIFSEKRMAIYYFLSPEMSVSGFLPLPPGLFAAAGSSGPVPDACRQQIRSSSPQSSRAGNNVPDFW